MFLKELTACYIALSSTKSAKIIFICWRYTRTFFPHSRSETFLEAAVTTLIPFVFVNHTIALKATCVHVILTDAASKETLAAVAGSCSVMLPRSTVQAYRTVGTESWRHWRISRLTNQRRGSARSSRWRHRCGWSNQIGSCDVVIRLRAVIGRMLYGCRGGKTYITRFWNKNSTL